MTSECSPEKPHKLFRFLNYLRTDLPSEVRCQELQALWNWQAAGFKAFQGFLAPVLPGGGNQPQRQGSLQWRISLPSLQQLRLHLRHPAACRLFVEQGCNLNAANAAVLPSPGQEGLPPVMQGMEIIVQCPP